jgi:hypothetical protein
MTMLAPSPQLGEAEGATLRTIPFDYQFEFELKAIPERLISDTIVVSVEGPFAATAIGYGFVPVVQELRFGLDKEELESAIGVERARGSQAEDSVLVARVLVNEGSLVPGRAPASLAFLAAPGAAADIELSADAAQPTVPNLSFRFVIDSLVRRAIEVPDLGLSAQRQAKKPLVRRTSGFALADAVLRNGFRLNPELADMVLLGLHEGDAASLSVDALSELFEVAVPPPENIQFKYALFDQGSGRAFQSDPILNTAGLGIADGSRPFRTFAQPITFAPRTTIRMDVIEVSRIVGTLHVVLHGYKVLGTGGTPTDLRRQARRRRRR